MRKSGHCAPSWQVGRARPTTGSGAGISTRAGSNTACPQMLSSSRFRLALCAPNFSRPPAPTAIRRSFICMAAATSSARSTAIAIWSPRPVARHSAGVCRSIIGWPEHPFPAAVDDALAAYRFLLGRGIPPGRIAIAGDSAGGGLVVSAMLAIRDAGLGQPACGWCISPWVDMEAGGATMSTKAAEDPTVQKAGILDMARMYLNGADPRSPLAAPIYADLRGLAPLLIQVGAAETLLDDAIRLAKVAGAADVRVDLQIWPEMIHVWHLFHPELSAGRRAIEEGGAWVRGMIAG